MKIWVLLSKSRTPEDFGTGALEKVFWDSPTIEDISLYMMDKEVPENQYLRDCFNDIRLGHKTFMYNRYYWIQEFEHKN